jgi:hypothetical protein
LVSRAGGGEKLATERACFRHGSAPPGGRSGSAPPTRGSASAPPGAALRASRWSRFGNEGEDPGAWCALSCATCRRARVFRNTMRAIGPTSSDSPRYPGQTPGGSRTARDQPRFPSVIRGSSALRPLRDPAERRDLPPSLPKRDQSRARRAEPGAADAKQPGAADANAAPAARTQTRSGRRGRQAPSAADANARRADANASPYARAAAPFATRRDQARGLAPYTRRPHARAAR